MTYIAISLYFLSIALLFLAGYYHSQKVQAEKANETLRKENERLVEKLAMEKVISKDFVLEAEIVG